jgi:hypothetical protein
METKKIKVPILFAVSVVVLSLSLLFWIADRYMGDASLDWVNLYVGCVGIDYVFRLLSLLSFSLFMLLLITSGILWILSLVSALKEKRIKLAKKTLKFAFYLFLSALLFCSFSFFIWHFMETEPWQCFTF